MKRRPPVPLLIFLILTLHTLNLLYSLLLRREYSLLLREENIKGMGGVRNTLQGGML